MANEYIAKVVPAAGTKPMVMIEVSLIKTPALRVCWCSVDNDPTGNCQLAILRYASVVFNRTYYEALIGQVIKSVTKPLLIIDIRTDLVPQVKELTGNAPGLILLEQAYNSTSGSNMCVMILNIKLIKDYAAYKAGTK